MCDNVSIDDLTFFLCPLSISGVYCSINAYVCFFISFHWCCCCCQWLCLANRFFFCTMPCVIKHFWMVFALDSIKFWFLSNCKISRISIYRANNIKKALQRHSMDFVRVSLCAGDAVVVVVATITAAGLFLSLSILPYNPIVRDWSGAIVWYHSELHISKYKPVSDHHCLKRTPSLFRLLRKYERYVCVVQPYIIFI